MSASDSASAPRFEQCNSSNHLNGNLPPKPSIVNNRSKTVGENEQINKMEIMLKKMQSEFHHEKKLSVQVPQVHKEINPEGVAKKITLDSVLRDIVQKLALLKELQLESIQSKQLANIQKGSQSDIHCEIQTENSQKRTKSLNGHQYLSSSNRNQINIPTTVSQKYEHDSILKCTQTNEQIIDNVLEGTQRKERDVHYEYSQTNNKKSPFQIKLKPKHKQEKRQSKQAESLQTNERAEHEENTSDRMEYEFLTENIQKEIQEKPNQKESLSEMLQKEFLTLQTMKKTNSSHREFHPESTHKTLESYYYAPSKFLQMNEQQGTKLQGIQKNQNKLAPRGVNQSEKVQNEFHTENSQVEIEPQFMGQHSLSEILQKKFLSQILQKDGPTNNMQWEFQPEETYKAFQSPHIQHNDLSKCLPTNEQQRNKLQETQKDQTKVTLQSMSQLEKVQKEFHSEKSQTEIEPQPMGQLSLSEILQKEFLSQILQKDSPTNNIQKKCQPEDTYKTFQSQLVQHNGISKCLPTNEQQRTKVQGTQKDLKKVILKSVSQSEKVQKEFHSENSQVEIEPQSRDQHCLSEILQKEVLSQVLQEDSLSNNIQREFQPEDTHKTFQSQHIQHDDLSKCLLTNEQQGTKLEGTQKDQKRMVPKSVSQSEKVQNEFHSENSQVEIVPELMDQHSLSEILQKEFLSKILQKDGQSNNGQKEFQPEDAQTTLQSQYMHHGVPLKCLQIREQVGSALNGAQTVQRDVCPEKSQTNNKGKLIQMKFKPRNTLEIRETPQNLQIECLHTNKQLENGVPLENLRSSVVSDNQIERMHIECQPENMQETKQSQQNLQSENLQTNGQQNNSLRRTHRVIKKVPYKNLQTNSQIERSKFQPQQNCCRENICMDICAQSENMPSEFQPANMQEKSKTLQGLLRERFQQSESLREFQSEVIQKTNSKQFNQNLEQHVLQTYNQPDIRQTKFQPETSQKELQALCSREDSLSEILQKEFLSMSQSNQTNEHPESIETGKQKFQKEVCLKNSEPISNQKKIHIKFKSRYTQGKRHSQQNLLSEFLINKQPENVLRGIQSHQQEVPIENSQVYNQCEKDQMDFHKENKHEKMLPHQNLQPENAQEKSKSPLMQQNYYAEIMCIEEQSENMLRESQSEISQTKNVSQNLHQDYHSESLQESKELEMVQREVLHENLQINNQSREERYFQLEVSQKKLLSLSMQWDCHQDCLQTNEQATGGQTEVEHEKLQVEHHTRMQNDIQSWTTLENNHSQKKQEYHSEGIQTNEQTDFQLETSQEESKFQTVQQDCFSERCIGIVEQSDNMLRESQPKISHEKILSQSIQQDYHSESLQTNKQAEKMQREIIHENSQIKNHSSGGQKHISLDDTQSTQQESQRLKINEQTDFQSEAAYDDKYQNMQQDCHAQTMSVDIEKLSENMPRESQSETLQEKIHSQSIQQDCHSEILQANQQLENMQEEMIYENLQIKNHSRERDIISETSQSMQKESQLESLQENEQTGNVQRDFQQETSLEKSKSLTMQQDFHVQSMGIKELAENMPGEFQSEAAQKKNHLHSIQQDCHSESLQANQKLENVQGEMLHENLLIKTHSSGQRGIPSETSQCMQKESHSEGLQENEQTDNLQRDFQPETSEVKSKSLTLLQVCHAQTMGIKEMSEDTPGEFQPEVTQKKNHLHNIQQHCHSDCLQMNKQLKDMHRGFLSEPSIECTQKKRKSEALQDCLSEALLTYEHYKPREFSSEVEWKKRKSHHTPHDFQLHSLQPYRSNSEASEFEVETVQKNIKSNVMPQVCQSLHTNSQLEDVHKEDQSQYRENTKTTENTNWPSCYWFQNNCQSGYTRIQTRSGEVTSNSIIEPSYQSVLEMYCYYWLHPDIYDVEYLQGIKVNDDGSDNFSPKEKHFSKLLYSLQLTTRLIKQAQGKIYSQKMIEIMNSYKPKCVYYILVNNILCLKNVKKELRAALPESINCIDLLKALHSDKHNLSQFELLEFMKTNFTPTAKYCNIVLVNNLFENCIECKLKTHYDNKRNSLNAETSEDQNSLLFDSSRVQSCNHNTGQNSTVNTTVEIKTDSIERNTVRNESNPICETGIRQNNECLNENVYNCNNESESGSTARSNTSGEKPLLFNINDETTVCSLVKHTDCTDKTPRKNLIGERPSCQSEIRNNPYNLLCCAGNHNTLRAKSKLEQGNINRNGTHFDQRNSLDTGTSSQNSLLATNKERNYRSALTCDAGTLNTSRNNINECLSNCDEKREQESSNKNDIHFDQRPSLDTVTSGQNSLLPTSEERSIASISKDFVTPCTSETKGNKSFNENINNCDIDTENLTHLTNLGQMDSLKDRISAENNLLYICRPSSSPKKLPSAMDPNVFDSKTKATESTTGETNFVGNQDSITSSSDYFNSQFWEFQNRKENESSARIKQWVKPLQYVNNEVPTEIHVQKKEKQVNLSDNRISKRHRVSGKTVKDKMIASWITNGTMTLDEMKFNNCEEIMEVAEFHPIEFNDISDIKNEIRANKKQKSELKDIIKRIESNDATVNSKYPLKRSLLCQINSEDISKGRMVAHQQSNLPSDAGNLTKKSNDCFSNYDDKREQESTIRNDSHFAQWNILDAKTSSQNSPLATSKEKNITKVQPDLSCDAATLKASGKKNNNCVSNGDDKRNQESSNREDICFDQRPSLDTVTSRQNSLLSCTKEKNRTDKSNPACDFGTPCTSEAKSKCFNENINNYYTNGENATRNKTNPGELNSLQDINTENNLFYRCKHSSSSKKLPPAMDPNVFNNKNKTMEKTTRKQNFLEDKNPITSSSGYFNLLFWEFQKRNKKRKEKEASARIKRWVKSLQNVNDEVPTEIYTPKKEKEKPVKHSDKKITKKRRVSGKNIKDKMIASWITNGTMTLD